MPEREPAAAPAFFVTSGYGSESREPYVEIESPEKRVQITPENARDLAMNLLQAAEAAYSDAFIIEFFTSERYGIELSGAVHLLSEFRKWRETKHTW